MRADDWNDLLKRFFEKKNSKFLVFVWQNAALALVKRLGEKVN